MFETTVQRALIRGRAPATIVRPQPVEPPWPEVTVVVPCYNYGRYLEDSVGSLLSQSEVEVRVVIIDDASPDGSAHIAERIAQRDSRVSLIRHETNAGHIATYNEGLGATQSEFVALLSADDLLTPGALGRATALMRAFPSVGFTYGRPVVFQGEVPPPARTKARTWTVWKGSDWIADRCRIGRNAIWAPEAVMRTSVLKEAGLFDAEHPHSGDLDLWLRMARISDVGLISGADQGWYREHLASMSRTTFAGQITDLKPDGEPSSPRSHRYPTLRSCFNKLSWRWLERLCGPRSRLKRSPRSGRTWSRSWWRSRARRGPTLTPCRKLGSSDLPQTRPAAWRVGSSSQPGNVWSS